jgi:hypothetical protein
VRPSAEDRLLRAGARVAGRWPASPAEAPAPAAICRKVAEAENGGAIEVWGDGTAIRVFTYVDDLVDGIYTLMQSELEGPVNLGSDERVTVADLVRTVIEVSGKRLNVKYVPGPVGVHAQLQQGKDEVPGLGGEGEPPRGHCPDVSMDRRASQGSPGGGANTDSGGWSVIAARGSVPALRRVLHGRPATASSGGRPPSTPAGSTLSSRIPTTPNGGSTCTTGT